MSNNRLATTAVALQFNGGAALPANSASEQFYVVTTTGAQATIGELVWDNGSGVGNATVIAAAERLILTEADFSGGTISFIKNETYLWDTVTSTWLAIGMSASVIYRQGAVNPVQPIYGSFAAAFTACKAFPGLSTLVIDNSLGAPVFGAGAYDFGKMIGLAGIVGQFAIVDVPTGVTFTNLLTVSEITLNTTSTAPIITDATVRLSLLGNAFLSTSAAGGVVPFISIPNGATNSYIMVVGSGGMYPNGANRVITVGAGNTLNIYVYPQGDLDPNSVTGAGTIIAYPMGGYLTIGAQAGAGAFSINYLFSNATKFGYTPAVAGNWNPAPTLISGALDTLAATQPMFFAAFSSLTTAVAQAIPPGSGALTSSADLVLGQVMISGGIVSQLRIRFTGAAGNVAGQTITTTLLKNGGAVAGASIAGTATTAGAKTGSVIFAGVAYVAGDIFTVTITPSAGLTTALVDVMASAA